jgi:predicted patatin/cPLA2 family phospholipase
VSSAAIVVEGGAMRGIFSAGALDVFLERGFDPFDLALGTSAGACNLASHLAGQHGRNRRCYMTQMRRPQFVDARRFLRGGHWLDLDYLWEAFEREDPLDVEAAAASRTRLVVSATCVDTGAATFLEPGATVMNEMLRASSAVPVLFRKFIELDGRRFADGGVTSPIPVEESYRRGARRILVIRSRPASFRGPSRVESVIGAALLREHPALARALRRHRECYERAVAFIHRPPPDCHIVHVTPERMHTSRTTRDDRALIADYEHGRVAGERAIRAWEALAGAGVGAAAAGR